VILTNATPDKSARQAILGYFHHCVQLSRIRKKPDDLQLIANHPVFQFED